MTERTPKHAGNAKKNRRGVSNWQNTVPVHSYSYRQNWLDRIYTVALS